VIAMTPMLSYLRWHLWKAQWALEAWWVRARQLYARWIYRKLLYRDILAVLWLLDDPRRFFAWYGSPYRWQMFDHLECALPGWDSYSTQLKWPLAPWQLVSLKEHR
jgi:hypothetical protein